MAAKKAGFNNRELIDNPHRIARARHGQYKIQIIPSCRNVCRCVVGKPDQVCGVNFCRSLHIIDRVRPEILTENIDVEPNTAFSGLVSTIHVENVVLNSTRHRACSGHDQSRWDTKPFCNID